VIKKEQNRRLTYQMPGRKLSLSVTFISWNMKCQLIILMRKCNVLIDKYLALVRLKGYHNNNTERLDIIVKC